MWLTKLAKIGQLMCMSALVVVLFGGVLFPGHDKYCAELGAFVGLLWYLVDPLIIEGL